MSRTTPELKISIIVDGEARSLLHIGEVFTISITSSLEGYLNIFSIGTTGKVSRVIPSEALGNITPQLKATTPFLIPGDISESYFPEKGWVENGPTTAETGRHEKLIAIVTKENIDLSPECVIDSARGAFMTVQETIQRLDDIPCPWLKGEASIKIIEARL